MTPSHNADVINTPSTHKAVTS